MAVLAKGPPEGGDMGEVRLHLLDGVAVRCGTGWFF
jgi:hypothetical protein